MKHLLLSALLLIAVLISAEAMAATVNVTLTAREVDLPIDNAGHTQRMWTYDGTVPGPLIRVTQGDTINFTLKNDPANKNSHAIDFHAGRFDVMDEFAPIKPGTTRKFSFKVDYPGVWMYHCGADSMAEHISRGMYGVVIVDPKGGYTKDFPKPDREYVLVQGDLFQDDATAKERIAGLKWEGVLINGKKFHYDPVHDQNASIMLESKPGERVRIYYVNAMISDWASFHAIAGIWDRVWDNGNPKNVRYGMQTVSVPPADGIIADIVSPSDRPTANAIVDHDMHHALNGGITILMNSDDADPKKGHGDELILR